jgi:hypothetical protein
MSSCIIECLGKRYPRIIGARAALEFSNSPKAATLSAANDLLPTFGVASANFQQLRNLWPIRQRASAKVAKRPDSRIVPSMRVCCFPKRGQFKEPRLSMTRKWNNKGYFVMTHRESTYPPSWRWRIVRRGEPMGLHIEGRGFSSYDAARCWQPRSGGFPQAVGAGNLSGQLKPAAAGPRA